MGSGEWGMLIAHDGGSGGEGDGWKEMGGCFQIQPIEERGDGRDKVKLRWLIVMVQTNLEKQITGKNKGNLESGV